MFEVYNVLKLIEFGVDSSLRILKRLEFLRWNHTSLSRAKNYIVLSKIVKLKELQSLEIN